jgi:hypothetical protein
VLNVHLIEIVLSDEFCFNSIHWNNAQSHQAELDACGTEAQTILFIINLTSNLTVMINSCPLNANGKNWMHWVLSLSQMKIVASCTIQA